MRIIRLLSLALLFAFPFLSHAQAVDAYGTFALAHIGTATVTTSHVSGITDTYTPASTGSNAYGVTFGGTYNFLDRHTQQLGIDIRETIAPSGKNGGYLTLGGLRYSAFVRHSRLHPYVELLGGGLIERSTYTDKTVLAPGGPVTTTVIDTSSPFTPHVAFTGVVGLDTRINHVLSYRAEFGGGHAGGSFAGDGPGGGALIVFNTGLVFHFDY